MKTKGKKELALQKIVFIRIMLFVIGVLLVLWSLFVTFGIIYGLLQETFFGAKDAFFMVIITPYILGYLLCLWQR